MKQKIKVVWLCHFTNGVVQNHIKPFKRISEFAPWIPHSIKLLENNEEIELHIISPHEYITGIKKYKKNGVYYNFYNAHMPIIGRHWPGFFKWDYMSNFWSNKKTTKKIVHSINPDIIHLHGAENAYFSSSVLQFFDKFPIAFSLQGFITHSVQNDSFQYKRKVEIEKQILKKIKYAFYRTETMKDQMRAFNPTLTFFWNDYPMKHPIPKNVKNKEYDLVFFARICKEKGIDDLLRAVAILKEEKTDISLCVIGGGNSSSFQKTAIKLKLENNVHWIGFLPTQEDVHQMASKARICVLPTYSDIISGTIVESLFLKIPVVSYNVGSIHEINKNDEIISLVEKWDIDSLAKAIMFLLNNPEIRKQRAEIGFDRVNEMLGHSDQKIKDSLINAYNIIITNFHKE